MVRNDRSTPDSLEAAAGDTRVMDGVPGVAVAQVILDQPKIVTPIRASEAAGVSQHVRMDWRQVGARRRGRDQIIDRLTDEQLAAFGDKEPGEAVPTGGQIALDSP